MSATRGASTGAGTPGSCASTPSRTTGVGRAAGHPAPPAPGPPGVRLLSKQRGRISRWLGLASEHEIVEALGRVDAPACEIAGPRGDRRPRQATPSSPWPAVNATLARSVRRTSTIDWPDRRHGPDSVHPAEPTMRPPMRLRAPCGAARHRDVERRVPSAVGEGPAGGVLDEHGRPLGDPVDPADPGDPLVVEGDEVARADRVGLGGDLAGGDQVVDRRRVAEDRPGRPPGTARPSSSTGPRPGTRPGGAARARRSAGATPAGPGRRARPR